MNTIYSASKLDAAGRSELLRGGQPTGITFASFADAYRYAAERNAEQAAPVTKPLSRKQLDRAQRKQAGV